MTLAYRSRQKRMRSILDKPVTYPSLMQGMFVTAHSKEKSAHGDGKSFGLTTGVRFTRFIYWLLRAHGDSSDELLRKVIAAEFPKKAHGMQGMRDYRDYSSYSGSKMGAGLPRLDAQLSYDQQQEFERFLHKSTELRRRLTKKKPHHSVSNAVSRLSMRAYVEITKSEHAHGGPGWEFGTCLWSPTTNRSGADRYSLMREPTVGDRVFHFYRDTRDGQLNTWLSGQSYVAAPVKTITDEPPIAGDWAGHGSYFRIELQGYVAFDHPITLPMLLSAYGNEIRDDLLTHRHRFYPFNTHGAEMRTVQGIYLARCSESLEGILRRAMSIENATSPGLDPNLTHGEYSEARRLSSERYFFARNPALARDAKQAKGYMCEVCSFSFAKTYGALGSEFIEAHHLDPLSERPAVEWSEVLTTSIAGIAVLCSNCHRMVHRRIPAYSLDELRSYLQSAATSALS